MPRPRPWRTCWRAEKDHFASRWDIARDEFDCTELQRDWLVFGTELDGLIEEMNPELVA
jgi:type I restriction enzyme, R subunit